MKNRLLKSLALGVAMLSSAGAMLGMSETIEAKVYRDLEKLSKNPTAANIAEMDKQLDKVRKAVASGRMKKAQQGSATKKVAQWTKKINDLQASLKGGAAQQAGAAPQQALVLNTQADMQEFEKLFQEVVRTPLDSGTRVWQNLAGRILAVIDRLEQAGVDRNALLERIRLELERKNKAERGAQRGLAMQGLFLGQPQEAVVPGGLPAPAAGAAANVPPVPPIIEEEEAAEEEEAVEGNAAAAEAARVAELAKQQQAADDAKKLENERRREEQAAAAQKRQDEAAARLVAQQQAAAAKAAEEAVEEEEVAEVQPKEFKAALTAAIGVLPESYNDGEITRKLTFVNSTKEYKDATNGIKSDVMEALQLYASDGNLENLQNQLRDSKLGTYIWDMFDSNKKAAAEPAVVPTPVPAPVEQPAAGASMKDAKANLSTAIDAAVAKYKELQLASFEKSGAKPELRKAALNVADGATVTDIQAVIDYINGTILKATDEGSGENAFMDLEGVNDVGVAVAQYVQPAND